jgi:ParB family chromosome partitioning protein
VARKQALGRGLKALIPDTPRARTGLAEIRIENLQRNPNQPRTNFDNKALAELADSIKEHGILQPLLVSDSGQGGYILIAGERRWRAAKIAGLETVPAVIREDLKEGRELEIALVENLQRRDLTPLEESRAFEHLRTSLGLSQAEIAQRVGFERSTVANSLRLLKLPLPVQELVESGQLSGGHARALLAFNDEADCLVWAHKVIEEGLSVRALEQAAAEQKKAEPSQKKPARKPAPPDPNLKAAEEKLAGRLGAKVEIKSSRRGAKIVISCPSSDELMRLFDMLMEAN